MDIVTLFYTNTYLINIKYVLCRQRQTAYSGTTDMKLTQHVWKSVAWDKEMLRLFRMKYSL